MDPGEGTNWDKGTDRERGIHVKAVGGERSWEEAEDTQVAARGLLKEGWGWLAGTFKDALLRAAIIKAPEKSPSKRTQESYCSTYTLQGASEFKNPISKDLKGPF